MIRDEYQYECGTLTAKMEEELVILRDIMFNLCSAMRGSAGINFPTGTVDSGELGNRACKSVRYQQDYEIARNTTDILQDMYRRYEQISNR